MKNPLNDIWASGAPVLNGWCSIGDPFVSEIMASQGYDSLTIDMQHGALSYSEALPMFQAMRASGKTLLARAEWRDPATIMKLLDAGAMGIICPMINNAAEAAEFVSYMRYPPHGQRSSGPTRASFAHPGYGVAANDAVLAFAMIETADGMENLEEITATPGLDAIYVGPSDLSLGIGQGKYAPGLDREEDEMITAFQKITGAAKKNGLHCALHCGTPEYAARALEWGFDMVTVSGDARLLSAAAGSTVSTFRELSNTKGGVGVKSAY